MGGDTSACDGGHGEETRQRFFWVAVAREGDFDKLRGKGFRVYHPAALDYVFLEAKPENEHFLEKEIELGVLFLRNSKELEKVPEAELEVMVGRVECGLSVGAKVKVLQGVYEGLIGEVVSIAGDAVLIRVDGWGRKYETTLKVGELEKLEG